MSMSKPKQQSTKQIIKPLVDSGRGGHPLALLFDGDPDNMPELKSVGCVKLEDTNTWVDYTIVSKGREIISVEVGEPNLRQIAEDTAKINFVESFMGADL